MKSTTDRLAHACPICNGCVDLDAMKCDRCGVQLPPCNIADVLRSYAEQLPVVLSVPNFKKTLTNAAEVIDRLLNADCGAAGRKAE